MENSRMRQGIAEVTEQAYARRHGLEEETSRRWWHIRTRVIVMTIICVVVGSLIVYWFVSSILESRRNSRSSLGMKNGRHSYLQLERLPRQVLPTEYTLKILPLLEEENFTAIGDVQIQLRCIVPTHRIRLHAHGLRIKEISFKEFQSTGRAKLMSKYTATGTDFIDVHLMQLLTPRESYVLRIKYSIELTEEPIGLFRTSYLNIEANQTRWIAVSNFSPDYARRAFPCFDEPWIKVPFRISIGRPTWMRSHSNTMRKVTEEMLDIPGYVWDHYEKTLPMSTYVVAFMVTDFSSYDLPVIDHTFHTVFARKDILSNTKYVGHLVPGLVKVIQNLTAFHYEPDKLDVIVVPNLAYSAMENWGLITFREDNIVIRNDSATVDFKRSFASTAAHEIAHQWFGNLVTPPWWDDVWLKEGFSSFFGYIALDNMDVSLDLEATFHFEFRDILETNGFPYAHSLHMDLDRINRLNNVFDETSYVMGNCVVYMMFNFLGKSTFLSSIRHYVRSHYYRTADEEELWSVFQEEIDRRKSLPENLTMTDIMRTWTHQAGIPILQVERDQRTGIVTLTQDRFYNDGLNTSREELWYIPLTWTTENNPQYNNTLPQMWMTNKTAVINNTLLSEAIYKNQWILFNVNHTSLYRVNYDTQNWNLLVKDFKSLPRITKGQLLDDAFAITKAGLLEHTVVWDILQCLETETDELLWTTALIALKSIHHSLSSSNAFKFLMCKLLSKVYSVEAAPLAFTEPKLWSAFKVKLMTWACLVGHKNCTKTVRSLSAKILQNDSYSFIPPEYRTPIYCTYVQVATEEEWQTLWESYKDAGSEDRNSLSYALWCHSNTTLLERYLLQMLENNTEDKQTETALMSVINNPLTLNTSMTAFMWYWEKSRNSDGVSSDQQALRFSALTNALRAFAMHMDQDEHVTWLLRLKGRSKDCDTIIDEVIGRVRINITWNKKHKKETLRMVKALAEKQGESPECVKRLEENAY